MLKIKCNNGYVEELGVSGKTMDIAAEALAIIREIYAHMNMDDEGCADLFKDCIERGMEIVFLSDDEINRKITELSSEEDTDINDLLNDLQNQLEELKKTLKKEDAQA